MNLNDYNYMVNINNFSREKRRINKTKDNQINNYILSKDKNNNNKNILNNNGNNDYNK